MNFVRKLVSGGGGIQSSGGPTSSTSDPTLGIAHLKKMFEEFRTTTNSSQMQQEKKLYNMLPLFCRVCLLGQIIVLFL